MATSHLFDHTRDKILPHFTGVETESGQSLLTVEIQCSWSPLVPTLVHAQLLQYIAASSKFNHTQTIAAFTLKHPTQPTQRHTPIITVKHDISVLTCIVTLLHLNALDEFFITCQFPAYSVPYIRASYTYIFIYSTNYTGHHFNSVPAQFGPHSAVLAGSPFSGRARPIRSH